MTVISNATWLAWPQTKALIAAFAPHTGALRFVGGAVRDTLLGREVHDVDAATTLTPDMVMALLEKSGIRAIPTGIEHGTVTAVIDGKHFEITTLRKDVATDGRHAQVAFTDDWKEDAARRDFTMNALYLSPEGEPFYYFGGETDARAGRVKFIGDPAQRIQEDYLRILRYFRFVMQVGRAQFDQVTLDACHANRKGITRLSGERITTEMLKLLTGENACPAIEKMHMAGLLSLFLTEHVSYAAIKKLDEQEAPALVKLAALISNVTSVDWVSKRLKLSVKQTKSIAAWLAYYSDMYPPVAKSELMKLRRKLGKEDYSGALLLAYAFSGNERKDFELHQKIKYWQPPEFPINGDDLITRGFTPGKALGEKLQALEAEWEAGDYVLTREQLLGRL